MKQFDLQDETLFLLAKQKDGDYDGKDIIDWGINVLINGYESENLYILVGLDAWEYWAINKYFKLSLTDLNISCSWDDQTYSDYYFVTLVKRILQSPKTLEKNIPILNSLLYETTYSENELLSCLAYYFDSELFPNEDPESYILPNLALFLSEVDYSSFL